MTKPIGATCNLDCTYCYYLHKEKLYSKAHKVHKMDDSTLRQYIRQYIDHQPGPDINFSWQGGEPTLLGLDYFEKIVTFQSLYCTPNKVVANDVQTNGTLLDDKWCEFFRNNSFLVGVSIDGPPDLHDYYRKQIGGKPSSDKVVAGIRCMQKHNVEFNTLTVLNRQNAKRPLDVYKYLSQEVGSTFLQFIPCVEPKTFADIAPQRWDWDKLPTLGDSAARPGNPDSVVTDWTVDPEDYGNFLIEIFNYWVRNDIGKVFVRIFDVMLGVWMGMPASACAYAEICGKALAVEYDGSLYSCDHYVYPEYKLGNINRQALGSMVMSERQINFGFNKEDSLPKYCLDCEVKFACHGECPKSRFIHTPDGEKNLNYLCSGLRKFLNHIDPYMKAMANELRNNQPAANIMSYVDKIK